MEIHIGKAIEQVVNDLGMNDAEFSRRIGTSRQNVPHIFQRKSMDTDLLYRISRALKHDFFSCYSLDKSQISVDKVPVKAKITVEYVQAHRVGFFF